MSEDAVEVMAAAPPLPPVSATQTETYLGPPPALTDALTSAVIELHASTTALHERYLRGQAALHDTLRGLLAPATPRSAVVEQVLDPAVDSWLADHRPNWTVPVLPGMSIADRLARAATARTGLAVNGLRDVRFRRWLTVREPVTLRTEVSGGPEEPLVMLSMWRESLSKFVTVATGHVRLGDQHLAAPARFTPLADASPRPSPYDTGELFHGPSMRYLESVRAGASGASGVLNAGRGTVPVGMLHHGLLDAAMHAIPAAGRWLGQARFGFPYRLVSLTVFEPLPVAGQIDVETRFAGFDNDVPELPVVDLQLCHGSRVLLAFRMVLVIVPRGRLGEVPQELARAFTEDRRHVPEMLMSTVDGQVSVLRRSDVEAADFLPGTVADLYGLPRDTPGTDELARIVAKEHVARHAAVHPSSVVVDDDVRTAWCAARPHDIHRLLVECVGDIATARSSA